MDSLQKICQKSEEEFLSARTENSWIFPPDVLGTEFIIQIIFLPKKSCLCKTAVLFIILCSYAVLSPLIYLHRICTRRRCSSWAGHCMISVAAFGLRISDQRFFFFQCLEMDKIRGVFHTVLRKTFLCPNYLPFLWINLKCLKGQTLTERMFSC